jgi:hypothetical protein
MINVVFTAALCTKIILSSSFLSKNAHNLLFYSTECEQAVNQYLFNVNPLPIPPLYASGEPKLCVTQANQEGDWSMRPIITHKKGDGFHDVSPQLFYNSVNNLYSVVLLARHRFRPHGCGYPSGASFVYRSAHAPSELWPSS